MNTASILQEQRIFFNSNTTKLIDFRVLQLLKLKTILKQNEHKLYDAVYKDFGKSKFDTYLTELSQIYSEIDLFTKRLKRWSKQKRVPTNLINQPARSYIIPEPLGNTLIIGAWNYPYYLSLMPAIAAIGAGNTIILKPSEITSQVSTILAEVINTNFPEDYFHVVEGGVDETTELLNYKFDKIFFTGSTEVGKIVYQAAAKHLTPVTLELGGKSPTFVLRDCNIDITAKRIVWSKFINAGQTCVAPDYVLVDDHIKSDFLQAVKKEIEQHYNSDTKLQDNYTKIINNKHYDRLLKLVNQNNIFLAGKSDKDRRYIGPTVLHNVSFEDAIMKEEIFGPILPVIAYTDLNQIIPKVKLLPKPLSCYIYSKSKSKVSYLLKELSFGGGVINDSVIHLSNSHLPFGGVGSSGMGSYHGKKGFDIFSHHKSILHRNFWFEFPLKYYPYTTWKWRILKWLFG